MEYSKLPGKLEHGMVRMGKGGLLSLHWHKETEIYFIFRYLILMQYILHGIILKNIKYSEAKASFKLVIRSRKLTETR